VPKNLQRDGEQEDRDVSPNNREMKRMMGTGVPHPSRKKLALDRWGRSVGGEGGNRETTLSVRALLEKGRWGRDVTPRHLTREPRLLSQSKKKVYRTEERRARWRKWGGGGRGERKPTREQSLTTKKRGGAYHRKLKKTDRKEDGGKRRCSQSQKHETRGGRKSGLRNVEMEGP